MKEDVIEYEGQFLLKDDVFFFNIVNYLDGEYEAKWNEKIFDTNIYVGANYHFDFNKLLSLFKQYENKYGIKGEWPSGEFYYSYNHQTNGGVKGFDYSGLKYRYINEVLNEDGTITSNITIEAEGGKCNQDGLPTFCITLYKFNNDLVNTVNYARFTSKDKMKEFLNDLKECIVCIDKDDIYERINTSKEQIKQYRQTIKELQGILDENSKNRQ